MDDSSKSSLLPHNNMITTTASRQIICDPVQQKGHLVGHVYSEIMIKTVCEIFLKIKGNSHFVKLVFSKENGQVFVAFWLCIVLVVSWYTLALNCIP